MKKVLYILMGIVGVVGMPVSGHHSAAAFDPDIKLDVTGTVASLEWTSPHARLHVDEVLEDGSVVNWNFELPSPVGLMRKGWRRDDLKAGETVTVQGFRAKAYMDIGIADSVSDSEGNNLFSGR